MSKAPNKGDVVLLDFNPQAGHEQAGKRPALVLSSFAFNDKTGLAFLCPITNQKKNYPFEVIVSGASKTTGVVLADQLKSLDWKARNTKVIDRVDDNCLNQVVSLVDAILHSA